MRPRNLVREAMRHLELHEGGAVLIKAGSVLAQQRVLTTLNNALNRAGYRGVVVVVDDFDDMRTLTPEALRAMMDAMAQDGTFTREGERNG